MGLKRTTIGKHTYALTTDDQENLNLPFDMKIQLINDQYSSAGSINTFLLDSLSPAGQLEHYKFRLSRLSELIEKPETEVDRYWARDLENSRTIVLEKIRELEWKVRWGRE